MLEINEDKTKTLVKYYMPSHRIEIYHSRGLVYKKSDNPHWWDK